MVLHHVSLGTNELRRAKAFYDPLMSELGLRLIKETERIIAYGLTETVFSIERPVNGERAVAGTGRTSPREATPDRPRLPRSGARQRRQGRGARLAYDRSTTGAIMLRSCDPDGNKLEIVTFAAE
jgi:catechol 2,3-dioxygenase-like lactoylglutathione lyase family enzyme